MADRLALPALLPFKLNRATSHALTTLLPAGLRFEPNRGQFDPAVKFVARKAGFVAAFLSDRVLIRQMGGAGVSAGGRPRPRTLDRRQLANRACAHVEGEPITIRFTHRTVPIEPEGLEELSGKVNYFLGSNAAGWRTNVPTYAKVRYDAVESGIDLIFYGRDGELECDFVVQPGADPSKIELAVSGAEDLGVSDDHGIVIRNRDGEVRLSGGVALQRVEGETRRVEARLERRGRNVIGVRLGEYDTKTALVIDPTIAFSTYLGGGSIDGAFTMTADRSGDIYVAGSTASPDFPILNAVQPRKVPDVDAFVTKISRSGGAVVYSTFLGGSYLGWGDSAHGIAVNASGEAYVTGATASFEFPTTPGVFQPKHAGCGGADGPCLDAFVAKLDTTGSRLVFSSYLGGVGNDQGYGIALDGDGNVYLTGYAGQDAVPGMRVFGPALQPSGAFVAKINRDCSAALYSAMFGGTSYATSLAVDRSGSAIVVGVSEWGGLPAVNAIQPRLKGDHDAFVLKLNPTGDQLTFSTYLGGSKFDTATGVAVDAAGNAVIVGYTESPDFPLVNPLRASLGGTGDAFIAVLSGAGAPLSFSTFFGGSGSDHATSVALDASGNAFVAGATTSADFPIANAWQPALAGGSDAFVAKFSTPTFALMWSSYLGGSGEEKNWLFSPALALDTNGNVIVTGITTSTDFPVKNPLQATFGGGPFDAFVVKISDGAVTFDAAAAATPAQGRVPLAVSFTATTVAGTPPFVYDWDFGDGTAHGATQNPAHTYLQPGSFMAALTVTDATHTAAQARVPVITTAPCTLACAPSVPLAAGAGQSVQFNAGVARASECIGDVAAAWDFGDFQSSTLVNPTHVYSGVGVYTWKATFSIEGLTCSKEATITVTESPANRVLMIPALAHIPGTLDTQWRSDLAVVNRSTSMAHGTVAYFYGAGALARAFTLAAGATTEWRDIVASLFALGGSSSGAVHVISDSPLVATARTYNQTAAGTFGQSYPALGPTDGLSAGTIGIIPQLRRGPAFRTNLGAINLGQSECTVMITLFGADGAQLGHPLGMTLAPGRWQQINDVLGKADAGDQDLAYAAVEIATPGGRSWAYASVIDNATGDPTTVPVIVP